MSWFSSSIHCIHVDKPAMAHGTANGQYDNAKPRLSYFINSLFYSCVEPVTMFNQYSFGHFIGMAIDTQVVKHCSTPISFECQIKLFTLFQLHINAHAHISCSLENGECIYECLVSTIVRHIGTKINANIKIYWKPHVTRRCWLLFWFYCRNIVVMVNYADYNGVSDTRENDFSFWPNHTYVQRNTIICQYVQVIGFEFGILNKFLVSSCYRALSELSSRLASDLNSMWTYISTREIYIYRIINSIKIYTKMGKIKMTERVAYLA